MKKQGELEVYGKLFASMFRGSLYGKWQAIVTFQQMIILADQDGVVDFTPEALSATTSIPFEIIKEGIVLLESPDPSSRSPHEEGRRIVLLNPDRPWGWRIVNYLHYRAIRTAEERRIYQRQYWHKRKVETQSDSITQPDSTTTQQTQPIAEAYAEAEASTTRQISDEISTTSLQENKNNVPYEQIVGLYHAKLPDLPKCVKITKQRKGYIRQRWLEDLPDIQAWEKYFDIVRQSKFLMGQAKGSDGRPPFRADLSWLCRPENIVKVIEGKYHRA